MGVLLQQFSGYAFSLYIYRCQACGFGPPLLIDDCKSLTIPETVLPEFLYLVNLTFVHLLSHLDLSTADQVHQAL